MVMLVVGALLISTAIWLMDGNDAVVVVIACLSSDRCETGLLGP